MSETSPPIRLVHSSGNTFSLPPPKSAGSGSISKPSSGTSSLSSRVQVVLRQLIVLDALNPSAVETLAVVVGRLKRDAILAHQNASADDALLVALQHL